MSLLGVERASHLPNPDFPVCCSRLDSVDKEILSFPECGDAHSSVKDSSLSTSAVAEHTPVEILSPDILSFVCPACAHVGRRPLKSIKEYDAWEQTGTEVTFRCPECKECLKCKNGPRLESISIQEEVEEALISRCVTVDLKRGVSLAKLPFLVDPDIRINDDEQRSVALKVFRSQVRNLSLKVRRRLSLLTLSKSCMTWDMLIGFVTLVIRRKL